MLLFPVLSWSVFLFQLEYYSNFYTIIFWILQGSLQILCPWSMFEGGALWIFSWLESSSKQRIWLKFSALGLTYRYFAIYIALICCLYLVLFWQICTFYQKGVCAYGSPCRYDHVKTSREQSYRPSSSANVHPLNIVGSTRVTSNGAATIPEFSSHSGPSFPIIPAWNGESEFHVPDCFNAWNPESGDQDFLEDSDVRESSIADPSERPICSFAAAGNCPREEKCPFIHGDLCPTCGKHCLHPFRPEEREEHMMNCQKMQKHLEALKGSQEIECSVCLERVLSKPTVAERKFGLLSECDHPFCISCIRNWRSSNPTLGMDVNTTLRACPICRKLSYFVIPSVIWYSTTEEKQEIIDSYKEKLK